MVKFFKKPSYNFKELLDAYKKKIKRIPWILGKNAFFCILILILIDILIGGFVFYQYVFLIETKASENISISNKFQENTYQSILKEWKNRENILENFLLSEQSYNDPFKQDSNELE